MSAFVDSLNLRPAEKRVIVVIGVVVFVALNFAFVFPEFKQKARVEAQLRDVRNKIATFQAEIAMDTNPTNGFTNQLAKLQKQEGGDSAKFASDIQLKRTVADQARATGIEVQTYDQVNTSHIGLTNQASQFFEKQSMSITAMATDSNLVRFLYNVGNDPAMIRVKELDFRPVDANRYQLKCRITLTADYKKTAGAKPASAKTEAPLVPTAKLPGGSRGRSDTNTSGRLATNVAGRAAGRTNAPGQRAMGPMPGGAAGRRTPPPMPSLPGAARRAVPPPGPRRGGTNQ